MVKSVEPGTGEMGILRTIQLNPPKKEPTARGRNGWFRASKVVIERYPDLIKEEGFNKEYMISVEATRRGEMSPIVLNLSLEELRALAVALAEIAGKLRGQVSFGPPVIVETSGGFASRPKEGILP